MITAEIKAIQRLNKNKHFKLLEEKLLPVVISEGSFIHRIKEGDEAELFYYLMPYYGPINMDQYVAGKGNKLEIAEILGLGLKLFDALKVIHKSGYIYNDLKLDNIMLRGDIQSLAKSKITLVDFGFAKKYYFTIKTDNGPKHGHQMQRELPFFQGNLLNASMD